MNTRNLVIDACLLVAAMVVFIPLITGIALHEWLGLVLFIVVVAHIFVHFDGIIVGFRSAACSHDVCRIVSSIFGTLSVFTFAVVIISGLAISGSILPALGFCSYGFFFWDSVHAIVAKLLLAFFIIHTVMNARKVISCVKRKRSNLDG